MPAGRDYPHNEHRLNILGLSATVLVRAALAARRLDGRRLRSCAGKQEPRLLYALNRVTNVRDMRGEPLAREHQQKWRHVVVEEKRVENEQNSLLM